MKHLHSYKAMATFASKKKGGKKHAVTNLTKRTDTRRTDE